MATTVQDISEWFDRGVKQKAEYMIIMCDTFSHEDFPVYCNEDDVMAVYKSGINGVNMTRVMEVYDMSMDKQAQLNETRAHHMPNRAPGDNRGY